MGKRVVFLGDMCRSNQQHNIESIYELFSPMLKAYGVNSDVAISEINKHLDSILDTKAWMESIKHKDIQPLLDINLINCSIVGFEIPDYYTEYFDQLGVTWVNLEIHPIRFLGDLCFSVRSSFSHDLRTASVNSELIQIVATSLKRKYARVNNINNHNTNTLLIIGQSPFDKSLWFDSEFKSLAQYFKKIKTLCNGRSSVIYRPHPYANDSSVTQKILNEFNAELDSGRSIYDIYSSGDVGCVCAISSSAVAESVYFGLDGCYLEPRARQFGPPINYPGLLEEHAFWFNGLLKEEKKAINPLHFRNYIPDNFLRDTFGYWGYISEVQKQNYLINKSQSESQAARTKSQQAENRAQQAENRAQQAENRAQQAEINIKLLEEKINTTTVSKFKVLKSLLYKINFPTLQIRAKFFLKRILRPVIQFVHQRQIIKSFLLCFLNHFPKTQKRLRNISIINVSSSTSDQKNKINDHQLSPWAHHILCILKTMMNNHNKKGGC